METNGSVEQPLMATNERPINGQEGPVRGGGGTAVMSPALKLLIDGMRIVMQVLVDEFGDRMTRDTREDIQQWYDRCYEMLGEGRHESPAGFVPARMKPSAAAPFSVVLWPIS